MTEGSTNNTPEQPEQEGNQHSDHGSRTRQVTFSLLLVTLVGLAVAFAGGWLRFGLEGPVVYVVYVIAGLLAAVTCYGLLESVGTLDGSRYGTNLHLGGAIVGFVVVAGGGGVYERYLHTPSAFSIQVLFYQDQRTNLTAVAGSISLHLGNEFKTESIQQPGRALFQGISSEWLGRSVPYSLQSATFQSSDTAGLIQLNPDNPIYIQVTSRPPYATPAEADVNLSLSNATVVAYAPDPTRLSVTFELRALSNSERPVPLDSRATFRLLNGSGVTVHRQDLELHGGTTDRGAIVRRGTPLTIWVDDLLPKDWFDLFGTNFMWTLDLYYDAAVDSSGQAVFVLTPMEFGPASIEHMAM